MHANILLSFLFIASVHPRFSELHTTIIWKIDGLLPTITVMF